jgi:hypothetical protein
VKASNPCAKALIFGSFSFLPFLSELFFLFIHPFSLFFGLLPFLLFSVCFFIALHCPLSFSPLFCLCSSAHVVSSLAYPNLLVTKRLDCCCCCCCMMFLWVSSLAYTSLLETWICCSCRLNMRLGNRVELSLN